MAQKPTPIPEWLIEKLDAAELSPQRRQQLERQFAADPDAVAQLEDLQRSNADILARYPVRAVVAEVQRRADPTTRRPLPRLAWLAPAVAAAAAAGMLLVWSSGPMVLPGAEREQPEQTRIKGLKPHLVLRRLDDGKLVRLQDGARARAGDRLQIAYVVSEPAHGVLLSLDGRGGVTLLYPEHAPGSTRLAVGGEVALPFSYELDDAPGFERFVLISSAGPFEVEPVLAAARQLAGRGGPARTEALALAEGLTQTTVTLIKEAP